MLKFDEKTGYLTLPGLRERIRVREGYTEGETGWGRVATEAEEVMYRALAAPTAPGEGAPVWNIHEPGVFQQLPEECEEGEMLIGLKWKMGVFSHMFVEAIKADGREWLSNNGCFAAIGPIRVEGSKIIAPRGPAPQGAPAPATGGKPE